MTFATPHASLLIHKGVHPKKISERLGHSSIKLMMDTYGHLFEGSDRDPWRRWKSSWAPSRKRSRATGAELLTKTRKPA
jgi:integrase